MAAIHNILDVACKAAKVDPNVYADEGKPLLDDPAYEVLVRWIALQARPKLPPRAQREIDRPGRYRPSDDDPPATDEDAIVGSLRIYAVKGARRAAVATARLLGPPFLDALAREIGRLDAVTLVRAQKLRPSAPIVASLWHGRAGAKITHRVVVLEGGGHGMIAKTKGRWTWLEGTREDLLATVPDAMMELAVEAVLGGAPKKKSPPAKAASRAEPIKQLPGRIVAVAIGGGGRMFAASANGRLAEVSADCVYGDATASQKIRGMDAGGDVVVTWGAGISTWKNGIPTTLSSVEPDGAVVRDDGGVIWWRGADIHFTNSKKARGFPEQTISLDRKRRRLVASSRAGTRVFDAKTGAILADLALSGDAHAVSPDGKRIATWKNAAAVKKIPISNLDDGKELFAITTDSGKIDRVVFATDGRILVRHHGGKRVSTFDARGALVHRLMTRDLGNPGSGVDEIFPLARGAVLAFAPYPRAETFLVDPTGRLLEEWRLQKETLYTGGKSFVADAGDRSLFAHSRNFTRLLAF
jgi:hypothetical protein